MEQPLSVVRNRRQLVKDIDFFLTPGVCLGEKSMYLPRLTLEHSGVYSCIVENILGKANQSVYLDVQCKRPESNIQRLD